MTCATSPANSVLAGSSRKRRISRVDGGRPTRPKRARVTGSRGSAVSGRDMKSRARVSHLGRKGSTSLRYAPASRGPKEAAVSPTDRDSTAAVPSGKGCAMGSSACSHSRPYLSSGRARNAGELMPSGCAAEHGSWRKPGRVSSSVRAPPPTVPRASKTATEKPRRASSTAAVSPFGPAPTTTASSIDRTSDPFVSRRPLRIRICPGTDSHRPRVVSRPDNACGTPGTPFERPGVYGR